MLITLEQNVLCSFKAGHHVKIRAKLLLNRICSMRRVVSILG